MVRVSRLRSEVRDIASRSEYKKIGLEKAPKGTGMCMQSVWSSAYIHSIIRPTEYVLDTYVSQQLARKILRKKPGNFQFFTRGLVLLRARENPFLSTGWFRFFRQKCINRKSIRRRPNFPHERRTSMSTMAVAYSKPLWAKSRIPAQSLKKICKWEISRENEMMFHAQ